MENLELSPVELMTALNWKKSKVYYWISQGKFQTVERLDGQKVVITREDLERLKKDKVLEVSENFETFQENFENSENVVQNSNSNVTKNYKNVSKNFNTEMFEFFNKSLETIGQIHNATLINFENTTKLLTDGRTEAERQNLELRAEVKTVQAKLKKSETVNAWKNLIIFGLIILIIGLIITVLKISVVF